MIETSSAKKSLLIVDDNQLYLDLICEELAGAEYQVETASTGKEGLSKIIDRKPDFVFLDLMLPDYNGVDLLRLLPAETGAKTKIVLLTATTKEATQWKEAQAQLERLKISRGDFAGVRLLPKPIELSGVRGILKAMAER